MVYITAFVLGALSAPLLPQHILWPPALLALLAVTGGVFVLLIQWLRPTKLPQMQKCLLLSCSSLCLGAALALVGVNRVVEAQLDESWQGRDLAVSGTIVEVIDQSSTFSRLHFRVDEARPEALDRVLQKRTLRLSWYYGSPVKAGQQWELTVRLKRPRGFVNPRGFDYGAWLLSQDLVATGYIKQGRRLEASPAMPGLQYLRQGLTERMFASDKYSNAFFQALLLGDKSAISAEQWRVLKRTGTIHLMAISGLHVGLVAGLGFLLGWLLCRNLTLLTTPRQSLLLARLVPPLVSCLAAATYSALAGFSIPTQRAMILVALANVALALGVRVNPLRLLALACIVVLLASPLAPTQSGFWLSFTAVLVLVMGFAGRQLRLHPVFALAKAQWLLAIGLLAPLLALGQAVSLVGPVANLVAVPLVSLVIVPGLLLATAIAMVSPDASNLLLSFLDGIFRLLWRYLTALSDTASAQWWPSFPTTFGLIAVLACAGVLVIVPRGLHLRGLGVLLLAWSVAAPRTPEPALTLTALEVGQGLAVWLRTPGYELLYDTGPAFSSDFDAGSRIVAPFLQTRGVRRLDTLIVSHGDNDHSGGLEGVMREMPVKRVVVGDPGRTDPDEVLGHCYRGQQWQRGELRFEVLWPPLGSPYTNNNSSCVLLVELGGKRILFSGDIDKSVERRLLAEERLPANVSVLIAPHHGSKTSSSRRFVTHTQPESVIFSAGYQNRYGHPHDDVVKRYRELGTSIYNTGDDGAVTFSWDSPEAAPRVERARHKINRAWY